MKLKLPCCVCNSGILLMLNKDKMFELRSSEILFSLKIASFEKLMKNFLLRHNLT